MHTKRIIPCLDVKDGRVVKGINFLGLKEVGDPVELARQYYEQGADELVFLDITATNEKRETMRELVEAVAKEIFIPFTVGGGIRSLDDIRKLLLAGADKVSLNSAAVYDPQLIRGGADKFGSQCIVLAIDAKKRTAGGWNVYTQGGQKDSGLDLIEWVKEGQRLGAGEILLTSMDARVPLIASGGCGSLDDFKDVFLADAADAALAASLFHYGKLTVKEVKNALAEAGIAVRKSL